MKNTMKLSLTIDNIEVFLKPIKTGNDLASVSIIIGEEITIHGFRISKSQQIHPKFQEKIWIQPPKYRLGPFYKLLVFIHRKELYSELEEKIYDKFNQMKQRGGFDRIDEDVNPDDVPL
jgi:sRNA-binding carbon storage regulator CsrA